MWDETVVGYLGRDIGLQSQKFDPTQGEEWGTFAVPGILKNLLLTASAGELLTDAQGNPIQITPTNRKTAADLLVRFTKSSSAYRKIFVDAFTKEKSTGLQTELARLPYLKWEGQGDYHGDAGAESLQSLQDMINRFAFNYFDGEFVMRYGNQLDDFSGVEFPPGFKADLFWAPNLAAHLFGVPRIIAALDYNAVPPIPAEK